MFAQIQDASLKARIICISRKAMPGLVVLVYYAYLQSYITLIDGDANYFLTVSDDYGFFPFLAMRYQAWSSRLIIEGLLVIMTHAPILWCAFNLLIVLCIWSCIKGILSIRLERELAGWFAALLLGLYPFPIMASAGWMATIMNYLWPLAAYLCIVCDGLARIGLASSPWQSSHKKAPILSMLRTFGILVLSIFLANLEQGAVLLCMISACFVYIERRERKTAALHIGILLIGLFGVVFALTCPGNEVRAASEVSTWWPMYDQLSLFGKIANGLEATTDRYLFGDSGFLLILTLTLLASSWQEGDTRSARTVFLRFTVSCALVIQLVVVELYRRGIIVRPALGGEPVVLPVLLLGLSAFILVFIALLLLFKKPYHSLFVGVFCFAAFASRMVLAFSPTLYASGERTFIFLDYSLIIVVAILISRFNLKCRSSIALCVTLVWFAALSVDSSIAFVLAA